MECFLKKSAPSNGCATLATLNVCLVEKPGRTKEIVFLPKVSIDEPLAARRRCPGRARSWEAWRKDTGRTDMSAPLSTRKEVSEALSKTDIDPEETVLREGAPDVIDVRRELFPKPE